VAPPAARKEIVDQYAQRNLEYARVSYAALDAARFQEAARKAYAALADPEAKLGDFFKDPVVQADRTAFRHPRRYVLEFLYTIHDRITTPEAYQRVEDLFKRTYPSLDVRKLEPKVKEMHDRYGYYRDRILKTVGSSYEKLRKELEKEQGEAEQKKPGDEGDGSEGGEKPPEPPAPSPDLEKTLRERGFELCRDQIDRELRLRGMFQWFRSEAAKDETKSLKVLFEKLRKHDDPKNPVCSTEPGKGLIVYIEFPAGLTASKIEKLKDGDVLFTHNVRNRVTGLGDTDLPRVGKADPLGEEGNGRMILRLIEIKKERRKTFKELTAGERRDLEEKYYLPAQARALAKQALEGLRARCVANEVKAEAFPAQARKLGCRVFTDEWITADYDFMQEPERRNYWPAEFLHMHDRYFLRRNLASALGKDRAEHKLKAGSYLDVEVDSGQPGEDPSGAAYLVLLLERRRPGPETMPPSELYTYLGSTRTRRLAEDNDRWAGNLQQLFSDFRLEFYGDMDKRIKDEMKRRAAAAAKRRNRG